MCNLTNLTSASPPCRVYHLRNQLPRPRSMRIATLRLITTALALQRLPFASFPHLRAVLASTTRTIHSNSFRSTRARLAPTATEPSISISRDYSNMFRYSSDAYERVSARHRLEDSWVNGNLTTDSNHVSTAAARHASISQLLQTKARSVDAKASSDPDHEQERLARLPYHRPQLDAAS